MDLNWHLTPIHFKFTYWLRSNPFVNLINSKKFGISYFIQVIKLKLKSKSFPLNIYVQTNQKMFEFYGGLVDIVF